VAPYAERRPDYDFFRDLGLALGQKAEDWPWQTYEEALAYTLTPLGITWEEFAIDGLYAAPSDYWKHEVKDPVTGGRRGFATTTGKLELYSELLAELGAEPLPVPRVTYAAGEEYPYLLVTGARFHPYYASSLRQIASLRRFHPDPWAEMSAETAAKAGLSEGDQVWVETERGRARFVVKLTPMCADAVSVEYGWWYPEQPAAEPGLGGIWEANANVLTSGDFATSDPLVGTWTYNGIPCRLVSDIVFAKTK
jgi:anaerobic selenocysteine-containing dehydrogenase